MAIVIQNNQYTGGRMDGCGEGIEVVGSMKCMVYVHNCRKVNICITYIIIFWQTVPPFSYIVMYSICVMISQLKINTF